MCYAVRSLLLEAATYEAMSLELWLRSAQKNRNDAFAAWLNCKQDDVPDQNVLSPVNEWNFDISFEVPFYSLFKLEKPRELLSIEVIEWDKWYCVQFREFLDLNAPKHSFYMGCTARSRGSPWARSKIPHGTHT